MNWEKWQGELPVLHLRTPISFWGYDLYLHLQSTIYFCFDNFPNLSSIHNTSLEKSSVAQHCRLMTLRVFVFMGVGPTDYPQKPKYSLFPEPISLFHLHSFTQVVLYT